MKQTAALVLDSRLRSTPSDQRPMSLFFAVERCGTDAEKANLECVYVKAMSSVTLTLPTDAGPKTLKEDRTGGSNTIDAPVSSCSQGRMH